MDSIWLQLWAIFLFPVVIFGCYKVGTVIASIGRINPIKGLYEPSEEELRRIKKRENIAIAVWSIIIFLLFMAGFLHLISLHR